VSCYKQQLELAAPFGDPSPNQQPGLQLADYGLPHVDDCAHSAQSQIA